MRSQNEDNRIKLYLKTEKPILYAGQLLQGTVYAEVLQDTPYRAINLSFVGSQKVEWAETYQKLIRSHKNERQTYRQELILDVFQPGIKKGHYQFPFNILIPASLPASVHIDENNYISYNLSVYLPQNGEEYPKKSYSLPLNIREPLRSIFSTISQGTTVSKCCGCFGNQTSGLFHIQVDRNEIHYTDKFKVRVQVDNTKGQFSFDQVVLVLTRRVIKVSDTGSSQSSDEDIVIFYRTKKSLKIGKKKKFEIELVLPQRILQYTAIGNMLSRTYFISLVGEVGCCYNNTRIQKHMILNNEVSPKQTEDAKLMLPQNWKPVAKPAKSFVSLKPYLFNPSLDIKIHNQKGNVLASTLLNMRMSAVSLYRTD